MRKSAGTALLLLVSMFSFCGPARAAGCSVTYPFTSGTTAMSSQVNQNFTDISNCFTGMLNGALTAPSFIATGATVPTNGMYLSGVGTLGFATNSTKVIELTSAGAVNIISASHGLLLNGSNGLATAAGDAKSYAIGTNALAALTTSGNYGDVAVGYDALQNTTGANNTAIGYEAGQNITSSVNNTFVGYQAGLSSSTTPLTGSFNTGIGNVALLSIISAADWDTAVGNGAGAYISTGSNNTAVGTHAIFGSNGNGVTGNNNTAIGAGALSALQTSATNNTALGQNTGLAVTTGASNVIIGKSVASTTLTTGSSNIYIGVSSAIDATTSSTSNELKIGNSSSPVISATSINSTPAVSLSGTAVNITTAGSVGIGTTTPATLLNVNGTELANQIFAGSYTTNTSVAGVLGSTPGLQLISTGNGAQTNILRYSNDAISGVLAFGKSRSTTPGTYGAVSSGDTLGAVKFTLDNGSLFANAAQIAAIADGTPSSTSAPADIALFTTASGALFPTERMRITTTGSVGIGTSSPSYLLQVGSASASGAIMEVQNSSAACALTPASGSPTWSCSSDLRLKKGVIDTGDQLAALGGMHIRDFTVRTTGERRTGVVAQEMLKTHPEMVHMGPDGYYTVDEPNPWVLVKAIQEQQAEIIDLRAMIDQLKAANGNLQHRLNETANRSTFAPLAKR